MKEKLVFSSNSGTGNTDNNEALPVAKSAKLLTEKTDSCWEKPLKVIL